MEYIALGLGTSPQTYTPPHGATMRGNPIHLRPDSSAYWSKYNIYANARSCVVYMVIGMEPVSICIELAEAVAVGGVSDFRRHIHARIRSETITFRWHRNIEQQASRAKRKCA